MKFDVYDNGRTDFARKVIELPFMPVAGHRLEINGTVFTIVSASTIVQDFTEQVHHSLHVKADK